MVYASSHLKEHSAPILVPCLSSTLHGLLSRSAPHCRCRTTTGRSFAQGTAWLACHAFALSRSLSLSSSPFFCFSLVLLLYLSYVLTLFSSSTCTSRDGSLTPYPKACQPCRITDQLQSIHQRHHPLAIALVLSLLQAPLPIHYEVLFIPCSVELLLLQVPLPPLFLSRSHPHGTAEYPDQVSSCTLSRLASPPGTARSVTIDAAAAAASSLRFRNLLFSVQLQRRRRFY
jgi:hypothetical protein